MTDEKEQTAAPRLLVVQHEGEDLHERLTGVGWNVVRHTNSPFPWLDDLENLMGIDQIIVSPASLYVEEVARDVERCISMIPTLLFVDELTFLELTVEDFK